jgi:hypothetical protein
MHVPYVAPFHVGHDNGPPRRSGRIITETKSVLELLGIDGTP